LIFGFAFTAAAAFAFSGTAWADDWDDCQLYRAIRGCTNIITTERDSAHLALAYYNRGSAYYDKGDYGHALADENKAIELDPQLALAYVMRGAAYGGNGNYDQYIADETRAIELSPQLAVGYMNRGSAYLVKADPDRAIGDETKAIELDPGSGVGGYAYYDRGAAYAAKGDFTSALTDFRDAARLVPTSDQWHGKALAQVADLEKQLAAATPASAAASPAQGYFSRGYSEAMLSHPDLAIADYDKAIEIDPRLAIAYANRGDMYGAKGGYDREIADESKAIELDPRLDYAYYNRGEAYLAAGSPANALADFRTAATLIPETDSLHSKALQHVADLEKQVASGPGKEAAPASERRVALVIGNGAYSWSSLPPLKNPTHDAAVVASTLRSLGFDVDVETDVTKQGMEDAFGRFARKARQADLTLVFYAGHGL
jgi:tetratricopeptide (TPR) repeat protein